MTARRRAPAGCGPQARWLCCSLLTYRPGYSSSLAPRQRAWGPAAKWEVISARALSMKATLLTITFFLFSPSAFGGESVRVGYGEADITPAVGGSMPGYFGERLSTGVLDPLRAKALTLSKDQTTLVIVALDLIGLETTEANQIRRAIRERTGIAAHHVFVHSTHTHTGAETPHRFTSDADAIFPGLFPGKVDEAWLAGLPGKVPSAVEKLFLPAFPSPEWCWEWSARTRSRSIDDMS